MASTRIPASGLGWSAAASLAMSPRRMCGVSAMTRSLAQAARRRTNSCARPLGQPRPGKKRSLPCALRRSEATGTGRWRGASHTDRRCVRHVGARRAGGGRPDAAALLGHVGAETMVCLQTDAEIDWRYPPYLEWLADPEPHEALRLPIEDHLVAPDGLMTSLIEAIVDRLDGGAVSSCGLVGTPDSWGRWCSSPMAPRYRGARPGAFARPLPDRS